MSIHGKCIDKLYITIDGVNGLLLPAANLVYVPYRTSNF